MEIDPAPALHWIVGGIGALLVWTLLARLVSEDVPQDQNQIFTSIAVVNGVLLVLGPSPMRAVAAQLVPLFPLLSLQYPMLVEAIVNVGTVLTLLLGMGNMIANSGLFGFVMFWMGFLGGAYLLVFPIGGICLIALAILMMGIEGDSRR